MPPSPTTRGRALEALGRSEEAEHAYDEALSIDHRLMPALSARASLLAARGDWVGALGDLDRALATRPDEHALKLRRGELLLRQGDWSRGLIDYEARLDIRGRSLHARAAALAGRTAGRPPADLPRASRHRQRRGGARYADAGARRRCRGAGAAPRLAELARRRRLSGATRRCKASRPRRRCAACRICWAGRWNSLPPPGALRPKAQPSARIGWFARTAPPGGIDRRERPRPGRDLRLRGRQRHGRRRISRLCWAFPRLCCCPLPQTGCGDRAADLRPGIRASRSAGEDEADKLAAWLAGADIRIRGGTPNGQDAFRQDLG